MRITRRGEYGINGLLFFAKRGESRVTYVREISRALDIPESFLAKIFQSFVHRGLLVSHRGVKGGYSLARPADSITLKETIEAAQGPLALNGCLLDGRAPCDRHRRCGLHQVLSGAQRELDLRLGNITIRTIADTTQCIDREARGESG